MTKENLPHFRNLKLYLRLGIKLNKEYRILKPKK